MELLDRYLESVRNCLPQEQRDDIINELSENLRSQIEDKESTLGRSLSKAEVEAILKQHGHPLLVAGRYRQETRSLSFGHEIIGPALFPFYLRVLKFNLGITSLIVVCIFTALFLGGQVKSSEIFSTFLYQFLIQFGVVTLIFAFADRHWKQHPDQWDAQNLKRPWHPAVGFALQPTGAKRKKTDTGRVSRFDSAAQIVGLFVGLAWLRVAQHSPFMIFGPAALFLKPGPVWHAFYFPVVALFVAGMAQAAMNLIRPGWVRLLVVYRVLNGLVWLTLLAFLLKMGGGHWVVPAEVSGMAEGYRQTVDILNRVTEYLLVALIGLAAYDVSRNVRRLLGTRNPGNVPAPAKG